MSLHTKQDQILQKLQRCLGKLSPKSSYKTPLSSPKNIPRYSTNLFNTSLPFVNKISSKYHPQHQNYQYQSFTKHKYQENKYKQNIYQKNDQLHPQKQHNKSSSYQLNYHYPNKITQNTYQHKKLYKPRTTTIPNIQSDPIKLQTKLQTKSNWYHPKQPLHQNTSYILNKFSTTNQPIQRQPFSSRYSLNSISKYDHFTKKCQQCGHSSDRKINQGLLSSQMKNIEQQTKQRQYVETQRQRPSLNSKLDKYSTLNKEKDEKIRQFSYCGDVSFKKPQKTEENNYGNDYANQKQKQRDISIGSITSTSKKNLLSGRLHSNYQSYQQSNELNLTEMIDEMNNGNEDSFAKLQKISELNERINLRIQNIISNFQRK